MYWCSAVPVWGKTTGGAVHQNTLYYGRRRVKSYSFAAAHEINTSLLQFTRYIHLANVESTGRTASTVMHTEITAVVFPLMRRVQWINPWLFVTSHQVCHSWSIYSTINSISLTVCTLTNRVIIRLYRMKQWFQYIPTCTWFTEVRISQHDPEISIWYSQDRLSEVWHNRGRLHENHGNHVEWELMPSIWNVNVKGLLLEKQITHIKLFWLASCYFRFNR